MTQDFAKKRSPAKKRTSARQPSTKKTPNKKAPQKRSNTRRPTANQKAPAWAWLLIGLLLAALVTLLIYLANREHTENTTTAEASKPVAQADKKTPQPRFDFYEILKEQEIKVEDRSAEIEAATPDNLRYYLQAGSFRNASDAESLKAELLLINLPANIEAKTNDNGTTWHRVIVGPFKSRSKMAKARSTLASKQLNPLLLKRTAD